MESIPTRPVVLTGYDLELDCFCGSRQILGSRPGPGGLNPGELVELYAYPGRYLLRYSLQCWSCGEWLNGGLTIKSRSAPVAAPAGYGAS